MINRMFEDRNGGLRIQIGSLVLLMGIILVIGSLLIATFDNKNDDEWEIEIHEHLWMYPDHPQNCYQYKQALARRLERAQQPWNKGKK